MRLALIAALTLAGCTSYADRVANTCERLGASRGTPEYWPCVEQQQAIDAHDRAAWGGMTAAGTGLISASQPRRVYLIAR